MKTIPRTNYDQVRARLATRSETRNLSLNIWAPVGRGQACQHTDSLPEEKDQLWGKQEEAHQGEQYEEEQGPSRNTRSYNMTGATLRSPRAPATPRTPRVHTTPRTDHGGLPAAQL